MRNTFLFEDILLEGRLEDVKKKHPNIDPELIDFLSQNDPSGNNKYLDWMASFVEQKIKFKDYQRNINEIKSRIDDYIIRHLINFHENINKISDELVTEVFRRNGWVDYLDPKEHSPMGLMMKQIKKSPKDINSYINFNSGSLEILRAISFEAKEHLTKGDIKKLETTTLLNNQDLLILIPKSFKSSCYYGAGTRWCTTSKENPDYYARYTGRGTLIYVLDKKADPKNNPWYKTAFFINKEDGHAEAFDAPDNPTPIKTAAQHLDKWDTIQEVIVNYLHDNGLKGVESFYFGSSLISWLESKGLDPLKVLTEKQLVDRIGRDALHDYLQKRGVNIYHYLSVKSIFNLMLGDLRSDDEYFSTVKKIWDGYKSNGLNPVIKLFSDGNFMPTLIDAVNLKVISLDEFLHESLKAYNDDDFNIYISLRNQTNNLTTKLLKLFRNDSKLIFEFAKTIGTNLFDVMDSSNMRRLLAERFTFEEGLEFCLQNKNHLRSTLESYGFPTRSLFEKFKNNPDFLITLITENGKLFDSHSIDLGGFITLYGMNEKAFWEFYKFRMGNYNVDISYVADILDDYGRTVSTIFPSVFNLVDSITQRMKESNQPPFVKGEIIKRFSKYSVWVNFYKEDYYKFYKDYEANGIELNPILTIMAWVDGPHDDNELKDRVNTVVRNEFTNDRGGTLITKGDKDYIAVHSLCDFENLFDGYGFYSVCEGEKRDWISGLDFTESMHYMNDTSLNIIKEYLMDNFRDREIVMNKDWIDEFDTWVSDINDENDTFTFTLYDERIHGMSDYKLQSILEASPNFKRVRSTIRTAFEDSVNTIFISHLKRKYMGLVEGIIGKKVEDISVPVWNQTKNKEVMRTMSLYEYPYLMEDVVAYAQNAVWNDSALPDTILDMIHVLMADESGRRSLNNGIIYVSAEDEADDYSYFQDRDKIEEEFTDVLYYALRDLDLED